MSRRRLTVAGRTPAVAVIAVILLAHAAVAATIVRTDPDDSRSPLDLRRLRVSDAAGSHAFRIATHEAFGDGRIDGDRGWFRIGFTPAGDAWQRSVYVYVVDGELRGVLADADGSFIRLVDARRIAPDRLLVQVPITAIPADLDRFAVWSVWNRRPCSRSTPCVDWLPDSGTVPLATVSSI